MITVGQGCRGNGEKWAYWGYVLEFEQKGLSDGLKVRR